VGGNISVLPPVGGGVKDARLGSPVAGIENSMAEHRMVSILGRVCFVHSDVYRLTKW
jgi:hypothetical protein